MRGEVWVEEAPELTSAGPQSQKRRGMKKGQVCKAVEFVNLNVRQDLSGINPWRFLMVSIHLGTV
jgi:hypothetical protein